MTSIKSISTINGFVDPRKTFWENIRLMSESANAWTTFDNSTGKWSVVINEVTPSSRSFTLDNILSELKISQVNITDQYNVCEISFPNRDVAGKMDTIRIEQPNRPALEPENVLTITNEFINDSITAKAIGQTLLNQSRNDKIVQFVSDYSVIGLTPGDVVDITLDTLGWTAKKFRVISIEEVDGDGGELFYNILCIEYYDSDYNYSNFTRVTTIESANVPPIKSNTSIETNKAEATGEKIGSALATDAGRAAITSAGIPLFASAVTGFSPSEMAATFGSGSGAGTPSEKIQYIGATIKTLIVNFTGPQATYNYTVDGTSKSITAGVPAQVVLYYSSNNVSYSYLDAKYMEWSSYITSFSVNNAPAGYYKIVVSSLNTFDLNATNNFVTVNSGMTSGSFILDSSGNAAVATWIAFLN